jgi:hypothetical protein
METPRKFITAVINLRSLSTNKTYYIFYRYTVSGIPLLAQFQIYSFEFIPLKASAEERVAILIKRSTVADTGSVG